MRKKLSLLLCLLLLASSLTSLVSCSEAPADNIGNNESGNTPSGGDVAETEPEETEITRENTPDSLPTDLKFDGTTINIYHFGTDSTVKYDCLGDFSGDVVLDAVYNRNVAVEERLGVKLNYIAGSSDWNGFPTDVTNSIISGSTDYDMIIEECSRLFQQSLYGYLFDINSLDNDYINFEQPWWYADMMAEGSLDNTKRFFGIGDINLTVMFGASACYFNKEMFTNYFGEIDQLYTHVKEGTWTTDVFADYCERVYTDLNGDGQKDAGDIMGFRYEQWGIPNYLSMSTGLSYITRDSDGYPVLDINNERGMEWGEKLYKLLYTNNISMEGSKLDTFINKTSLFLLGQFDTAHQLRDVDFSYGLLPYPKMAEDLDYMSAAATVNGNGVGIPVSAPVEKIPASCAAIELLCAESYRHVVPAWYDTALKIKYSDGLDDAQMVDIIYEHIGCPFIMMADKELGTGSIYTYGIWGSTTDGAFASYYAGQSKSLDKKLARAIEDYKKLGGS